MSQNDLHVVILAAGKGTRMRSRKSKVLHALAGLSLLEHTLKTTQALNATSVTLVLSQDQEDIRDLIQSLYPFVQIAFQSEQKGTAHAVLAAESFLKSCSGTVLILFADTPLIKIETLGNLAQDLQIKEATVTILGVDAPGHSAYGRLVLDAKKDLSKIVEIKDASEAEKNISLCNSGLMACRADRLFSLLKRVKSDNQAGEYYLTDIVALAREQNETVTIVMAADPQEMMGINTRHDLAAAEAVMQARLRDQALSQGVTLLDPVTTYFSYDTLLSEDVVIYPCVYFGVGVRVDAEVVIHAFSHLEGVHVKRGASVGPYARLRPGTVMEEGARVGNFVELKNTTLGKGSKASHLSYLGDASIGENCNIGAGTITCNYDGYRKYQTVVEKGVFIGSHSTLIAPLTLREGAYIGAGSVLTKEVKANALALSRVPQTEREGGAESLRQRFSRFKKRPS